MSRLLTIKELDGLPLPNLRDARSQLTDEKKVSIFGNEDRFVAYASADHLYVNAIFGRDGLQMALDCLQTSQNIRQEFKRERTLGLLSRELQQKRKERNKVADHFQELARDICVTTAQLQGETFNEVTGEEPGKIHHEYRNTSLIQKALRDGKITREDYRKQMAIIDSMEGRFGGKKVIDPKTGREETEVLTYYSVDSTPLFLKLAYAYLDSLPDDNAREAFLNTHFYTKSSTKEHPKTKTVREAMLNATNWLTTTMEKGPLYYSEKEGQKLPDKHPYLLSWQHTNGDNSPHNQVLEDSQESWFHPDGTLTNEYAPRIPTEVQGVVYDVLKKGADYLHKPELREAAKRVQEDVIRHLWMEDKQYFAMGLDIDPQTGEFRQVETLGLSSSELLNSDLLVDLGRRKKKYISGIVNNLYDQKKFLTPYGLRTQAKEHMDVFVVNGMQFSPYHSAETIWPVLNGRIIEGLDHVGLSRLASDLRNRMMNGIMLMGTFVEFIPISKDGVIANRVIDKDHQSDWRDEWKIVDGSNRTEYSQMYSTNYPELTQGWTYSAAERERDNLRDTPTQTEGLRRIHWTHRVQRRALSLQRSQEKGNNEVVLFRTPIAVQNQRRSVGTTQLNTIKGQQLQADLFHQKWQRSLPMQLTADGLSPADTRVAAA